jgi:prolyl-tRNA synthetase
MSDQVKRITKKSQNISDWYNDVIASAKLAEHGPVRGTMIIRPLGYAIWEGIQRALDSRIKDMSVPNAYFPLLIPYSFLQKEKTHVKGFSPELAIVTHAGGEELKEPLVVRPTSETIIYNSFASWIQSFRDLPMGVNLWNNVVRWEKRPYLFLRTTEFLWQEGHTAHATNEESQQMVDKALEAYVDVYQSILALWGYVGRKSESEKFAGAEATYTYEILMPDGRVLQGCTSHNLGQNFSKVFGVEFQDKDKQKKYVWQTSWGFSTRSIGGLILAHGDDNGLVLPPMIAPTQVVIIPIISKSGDQNEIDKLSQRVFEILKSHDIRVKLDDSDQSPGWKFNQYELEGVPLRIEVGASEARDNLVRIVRRDNKGVTNIGPERLVEEVHKLLQKMQHELLEKSKEFTLKNTRAAKNYEEFKEIMNTTKGFIEAFWCENPECEEKIKEETKASTRCLPLDSVEAKGECVYCGKSATHRWLFGQSY